MQAYSENSNYITIRTYKSSRYFIVLSNLGVTGVSGSIHGIYILEISNDGLSTNLVNIANNGINKVSLSNNVCTIYFTDTYVAALLLEIKRINRMTL